MQFSNICRSPVRSYFSSKKAQSHRRQHCFLIPLIALITIISSQVSALEIPVSSQPKYIAVNSVTHQAIIGYKKGKTLDVFDINSASIVSNIALANYPSDVAIDTVLNVGVIALKKDKNISFIDLSNGAVIGHLNTGTEPRGLAVDSTQHIAVVANKKDDTVSLIDINTQSLIATIAVGVAPYYVAIDPVAGTAWVSNKDDNTISVVDMAAQNVIATIPVGSRPERLTVDGLLHRAVVLHPKNDSVSIIDVTAKTVLQTLAVGTQPSGIALNANTHEVWVTNEDSANVSVIDLQTMTVTDTLITGATPTGIAIDAIIGKVVVANLDGNSLSVIAVQGALAVDRQAPTMALPQNIFAEATSANGATVTYSLPLVTDNTDPNPSINCNPTTGIQFALGNTTVNCTASDAAGNTANASFIVTVQDTTAPAITAPIDVNATSFDGNPIAVTTGTATATDVFSVSINSDALALFPVGITTVTWAATDANGNSSNTAQQITVNTIVSPVDTVAPVVTAPADVSVEATGTLTPVILGLATATDAVDGSLIPTNDASATFSLGTTTVTWSAIDAAGNVGTATQTVNVVDNTSPQLTAPQSVTASSSNGSPMVITLGQPITTDIFPVTLSHNAPSQFPVGSTVVTWQATDSSGNIALATQTVNVTDVSPITPPPTVPGLPPDPGPAGELTLAGIDSDNDGVRDDVQRWIALMYPDSQKVRAALRQRVKLNQKKIMNANDAQLSIGIAHEAHKKAACFAYIDPDNFVSISKEMNAIFYNTLERTKAVFQVASHVSGQAFTNPPISQWKQSCDFDPDAMPN